MKEVKVHHRVTKRMPKWTMDALNRFIFGWQLIASSGHVDHDGVWHVTLTWNPERRKIYSGRKMEWKTTIRLIWFYLTSKRDKSL